MNYTKMLKLLYLADRKSLLETGSTITGDNVVNMTNGPVLSQVYDCIKGNRTEDCVSWSKHLRKDSYELVLEADPGDSELSDYDVNLLTALAREHQRHNWRDMVNLVHELPEWEDPGATSVGVDYDNILQAADLPVATIQSYQALNAAARSVDRVRVVRR
jgi:hypothetical protein